MSPYSLHDHLHNLAQTEIEATATLWPDIERRMRVRSLPSSKRRFISGAALVRVVILLLTIGLVAGGVYALVQQLTGDPGLDAVASAGLVTHIRETRTVLDNDPDVEVSVTLEYAYADANRITVVYTTHGTMPAFHPATVYASPILTEQGRVNVFPTGLLGIGSSELVWGESTGDGRIPFSKTDVFHFAIRGEAGAPPAPVPSSIALTLAVQVVADSTNRLQEVEILGTATFNFELPIIPGRVLTPDLTKTAAGIVMTLEQVTISPSLALFEMCYADPLPDRAEWEAYGELEVDGLLLMPESALNTVSLGDNPSYRVAENTACHQFQVPYALIDTGVEWTLRVNYLLLPGSEDIGAVEARLRDEFGIEMSQASGSGYQPPMQADPTERAIIAQVVNETQDRIEGPWVFTFNLLPETE